MQIGIESILLYGGGGMVGLVAVVAVIFFFVSRLKKERLMSQLKREYGEW